MSIALAHGQSLMSPSGWLAGPSFGLDGLDGQDAGPRTRSVLQRVIDSFVIPQLSLQHPVGLRRLPAVHAQATELARLLLQADPHAAAQLVIQAHAHTGALDMLCASLLEPAARALGDLWQVDDCSEFEVTLGLARLQTAMRALSAAAGRSMLASAPTVLVAPQPGEIHLLGAALDAELLWQAGWHIHAEFPCNDAALQTLLADTWFDALDLSLSAAFGRDGWLPRMRATVAHARAASRNPALVVVVGGRVFGTAVGSAGDAGQQVGADGCYSSALQVASLIGQSLPKHN